MCEKRLLQGLLAAVLLWFLPQVVWAKDTITWMKYVWAPIYIQQGPFQGQGNADAILKFLQDSLPEYEHKAVLANPARAIGEMREGKPVCMVGTLKTAEREEFLYFSIPIGITLPNAILIKKSNVERFGTAESLSLAHVLQQKQWVGGVVKGRSYTPAVDAILNQHKGQSNLFEFPGIDAAGLLQMLQLDRVHYVIEYPWVAEFLAKSLENRETFASIAIQEIEPYGMGQMACAKTPLGRQIVDRVNAILKKARPTPQYREFVERWNSEGDLVRIRKFYDDVFLKTTP